MTYKKEDPASIQHLFNTIAKQYEQGNAILSFNTHRLWNRALIAATLHDPTRYLDLCAGTGQIAFSYLKKRSSPLPTYLLDFSSGMLAVAKEKAPSHHPIEYLQADAEAIPLLPSTVDAVTCAYGIRNIQNPSKAFSEVYRVLTPGGTFGILELTRPHNPLLRSLHSLYLRYLVPLLGKWITSDKKAYEYLCNTIHHFVSPENIKADLLKIGFCSVTLRPLFGGIATLLIAKKNDNERVPPPIPYHPPDTPCHLDKNLSQ